MTLTPEQLAKSDEEFEAMMRDKYPFHSLKKLPDGSVYLDANTFWIHKGWSLRQESLVVELPRPILWRENESIEAHDHRYTHNILLLDFKDSLDKAGINYREKE